jgi:hypothetical protein
MRLLSNLHVKGKPAVLPDRAIHRQSHYFIYRPRIMAQIPYITCNLLLMLQHFLYFLVMHLGRFSCLCCRRNAQNLINYQWKCNLNGLEGVSVKNELMQSQQLVTSHKIVKKYYHYMKILMYISGFPTSINLKHGRQFQMTVFQCQNTKTKWLNQFQVTEIIHMKVITNK